MQLSQEETIRLKDKTNVDMQIRVLYTDGTADDCNYVWDGSGWAQNKILCTAQDAGTLTFRSDAAGTVNALIINLG